MMLQLPANLSEIADPARLGSARNASGTGEMPVEWGELLGLLLNAEPGEAVPTLGPIPAEGAPAPAPGSPEALARALFMALQGGKTLPPGGGALPLPSQLPGQSGTLPAGFPAPVAGADPADGPTEAMARMLDLLRTLQGVTDPPAASDGDLPVLQRAELKLLESTEAGRLLLAASPPAASATATAGPASAATASTAAAPTTGTAATPPSLPITTAPDQPGWDQAVGQRVLWMVANKSQVAELRLTPPELGPLEVKVRQDDDGLRLTFAAGNGAVRDALEAAAPRLREMFQAEGLRLENLDIGQRQADGERAGDPAMAEAGAGDGAVGEEAESGTPTRAVRVTALGLVDLFV